MTEMILMMKMKTLHQRRHQSKKMWVKLDRSYETSAATSRLDIFRNS